jgi:hypothetical protein
MLHGIPVALAVMEFGFMGGSMGSVVGEKLTRLIEYATQEGLTLMVVCTSGGARMQVRECWDLGLASLPCCAHDWNNLGYSGNAWTVWMSLCRVILYLWCLFCHRSDNVPML